MLTARSIHYGELVSECDDLQVQRCAGANEKAKRVKQRDDDRCHEPRLPENVGNLNRRNVYGVFNRHRHAMGLEDPKQSSSGPLDARRSVRPLGFACSPTSDSRRPSGPRGARSRRVSRDGLGISERSIFAPRADDANAAACRASQSRRSRPRYADRRGWRRRRADAGRRPSVAPVASRVAGAGAGFRRPGRRGLHVRGAQANW